MPSFIKEENKLYKNLPSATLNPVMDSTNILFNDIFPEMSQDGKTTVLKPIKTKINTKIIFVGAQGVQIPDENLVNRQTGVVGRLLKIGLFNSSSNKFFGNTISIECSWDKEFVDRWKFKSDKDILNNNIIVRYEEPEDFKGTVSVIFEFVLLIMKEGTLTEISCGFASKAINDFLKKGEVKIKIESGSPNSTDGINIDDIKAKRTAFAVIDQLLKKSTKSELEISFKCCSDMANDDKIFIRVSRLYIIIYYYILFIFITLIL